MPNSLYTLAIVGGYVVCALVGLLGLLIVWRIIDGTIDLSRLISEPNGDASMSRFQLLVFTFVVALSLFLVIVGQPRPTFPEAIPGGILALLGISGSSYLISKGIQFSSPAGVEDRPPTIVILPNDPTVGYGAQQAFKAEVSRLSDPRVKWEVLAGPGAISAAGLYSAPATPAPGRPAPPAGTPSREHATVRASLQDDPEIFDLAVVTIA